MFSNVLKASCIAILLKVKKRVSKFQEFLCTILLATRALVLQKSSQTLPRVTVKSMHPQIVYPVINPV